MYSGPSFTFFLSLQSFFLVFNIIVIVTKPLQTDFFFHGFEFTIRFPLFHCYFSFFFVLRICSISESFVSFLHLSDMYML